MVYDILFSRYGSDSLLQVWVFLLWLFLHLQSKYFIWLLRKVIAQPSFASNPTTKKKFNKEEITPSPPTESLDFLPLGVSKGPGGSDRWTLFISSSTDGLGFICAEERCHDNKDRLGNDTLYQSDVERRETNQLQFNEEWNGRKWKCEWKCVITCCTLVCSCSLLIEGREWALQIHYFLYISHTHRHTCWIYLPSMGVHLFAKSNQTHLWFARDLWGPAE